MATGNSADRRPAKSRKRGPYAGSAEKRAAIVDAAFKVFAEHGYQAGSLQKIADTIGVSQTSLLHYFPKKADLLLAVLEKRDELGDVEVPVGDADLDFADAIVRQAEANEHVPGLVALYTVLSGEAVTQDNPGQEFFRTRLTNLRADYAGVFERMRDQGLLRAGVDPASAAIQLIALWEGLQQQWLLDPEAIDVPGELRRFLDGILAG